MDSLFIVSGLSKSWLLYREYIFIRGKYVSNMLFLLVAVVLVLIFSHILMFEKIHITQDIIITKITMIKIFDMGSKIDSQM